MKLWLVRHARPLLPAGVCYGALDVPADAQATRIAAQSLAQVLPANLHALVSPLQRCTCLASELKALRPDLTWETDARLTEMDFGHWEGQRWDALDPAELQNWTDNFGPYRCGGAESVDSFMLRVGAVWDASCTRQQDAVWITHAGVIRAADLLAQGMRQVELARSWPRDAPAWGEWKVLDVQYCDHRTGKNSNNRCFYLDLSTHRE